MGEASGDVAIALEGVPDGAEIYFDGLKVPGNPFRVKHGSALVPVQVKAEGLETFETLVAPDKDQTIKVVFGSVSETKTKASLLAHLPGLDDAVRDRKASARSFKKGMRLQRDGNHGSAVRSFEKAISMNPSDAEAYCELSDSLRQLDKFAMAAEAAGRLPRGLHLLRRR